MILRAPFKISFGAASSRPSARPTGSWAGLVISPCSVRLPLRRQPSTSPAPGLWGFFLRLDICPACALPRSYWVATLAFAGTLTTPADWNVAHFLQMNAPPQLIPLPWPLIQVTQPTIRGPASTTRSGISYMPGAKRPITQVFSVLEKLYRGAPFSTLPIQRNPRGPRALFKTPVDPSAPLLRARPDSLLQFHPPRLPLATIVRAVVGPSAATFVFRCGRAVASTSPPQDWVRRRRTSSSDVD